jgi:hypothetical protein
MGMRTLDDLRGPGASLLTHQQRVGLAYFDELQVSELLLLVAAPIDRGKS